MVEPDPATSDPAKGSTVPTENEYRTYWKRGGNTSLRSGPFISRDYVDKEIFSTVSIDNERKKIGFCEQCIPLSTDNENLKMKVSRLQEVIRKQKVKMRKLRRQGMLI